MKKSKVECPNCDLQHDEEFHFCPHCGQKTDDEITIGNLFYNTISNYFSFDARFLKSFVPLMFKPGYLAREFVGGKRLRFLHPAQMYLFVSVIFFFLFSFIQREQASEFSKVLQNQDKIKTADVLDSLNVNDVGDLKMDSISSILKKNPKQFGINAKEAEKLDSIITKSTSNNYGNVNIFDYKIKGRALDSMIDIGASEEAILKKMGVKESDSYLEKKLATQILRFQISKDGGSLYNTFYQALPIAMFFLLPIFALLIWLFYIGKGNFAHHLIFSFYFFSFQFAFYTILVAFNLIFDLPGWIYWLLAPLVFIYFIIALRRFYRQGRFLSFVKGSVLSFLFLSIVVPITFSFMIVYSFLFY